jgi:cell division protein FtsQ
MVKKILSIVLWVATAAALVWLFVYAREDYLHTPLKAINLIPETDTGFVSKSALYKEIESFCKEFGRSKEIKAVDMIAVQEVMKNNAWIESSTSYIDLDGVLNVSFKEYEPWFRVFGKDGHSVYVTRKGIVIPSSRIYTPYVLVASGNFELRSDSTTYQLCDTLDSDRNLLNALHWCEAIERNNFVSHGIGQLYCNKRNQFELTVKGFDGRVIVGDTCDAADKLWRLESFMKQRIDSPETKTLKSINLNYKNQIVCTKR